MVYAIFTLREPLKEHSLKAVKDAFKKEYVRFERWNFVGTLSDLSRHPEVGRDGVNAILRLEVINESITVQNAEDKVYDMFMYLLKKGKVVHEFYSSNQFDQATYDITFMPTNYEPGRNKKIL